MVFPDSVVSDAWDRSGGYCECNRVSHPDHLGRKCGKALVWANRGRDGQGAWEAHHRVSTGPDTLSNCEILCWKCHKLTIP